MSPLLFVSFLSALSSPSARNPAPAPRVLAQRARLDSGWKDLERRAARFLSETSVESQLRGGGIAFDRVALFAAAARALSGGPAGSSILLEDPGGTPIAWSGRSPAFLPTDRPEGAVWSAASVTFFQNRPVPLPQAAAAGRLVISWWMPREGAGLRLDPSGGLSWSPAASSSPWTAIVASPLPAKSGEGRRRQASYVFLAGSLILLVWAAAGTLKRRRAREVAAALAFVWGTAGAVSVLSRAPKLEPADYFRDAATLFGFSLAALAAALFALAARGKPRWIPAISFSAAAFGCGVLWPGSSVAIAAAFGLAFSALILSARGPRRPLAAVSAAALAAAALFGALCLWRESRTARAGASSAEASAARPGPTVRELSASAAAQIPARFAAAASRFSGAAEEDLSDLAFVLWKEVGLGARAPVSGIRLWREGRLVSRFASGIPLEASTQVAVGGNAVAIERTRVPLEERPEFRRGEAPLEAEIEVGDWPSGKPLPLPMRDYRDLLLPAQAIFRAPVPALESVLDRVLESFTAAIAAFAALLIAGGIWAAALLLSGRRRGNFLPRTFRGRITALFTLLVLVPFVAVTIFIRQSLAARLRRETVLHAQTALSTARTVLDDYLFAAGTSPGRRQLIDDDLLSWMSKIVGHDLSIYTDGRLYSTSRRELFASGLLPERIEGKSLAGLLGSPAAFVVESRLVRGRRFDQVQSTLTSIAGQLSLAGPAVLSIPLLPEQRESEEQIARLSASLTAFTVLVFGLSLVLGARVAFRVSGPIGDLVEGTRAVARGQTPNISLPEDEELRRLVEAFLSMAGTLEAQREDLARAQRLRAWAEMARIIAHEIKNPLTPIRLSAEHLREVWRRADPNRDRVLEECVANILQQTETLRSIAAEFSDFARLREPQRESVELRGLVEGVVRSFSAAPGIRWSVEVPEVSIHADPKLLARAVTNLVANSREALGAAGGTICVRAEKRGDQWTIRVEDDGPGVTEEDRAKLFEPYFSSKSGGSGLGLAIVRKIAQEHGGDARAERLLPRGFAVEFDLRDSGGV
ncbi:MAG: ATP-binding protein [Thermoanaerobaculia bacterium]